jgi:hypothetical protein
VKNIIIKYVIDAIAHAIGKVTIHDNIIQLIIDVLMTFL